MLAKVDSCAAIGIDGFVVDVEVDVSNGLPAFHIVGLPEASVKESKDRVATAIRNCGYSFPIKKVVVNLAPAGIKKEGTGFDLPIAVGVLTACDIIPAERLNQVMFSGELSLDGYLKPVKAVLSYALLARDKGYSAIVVPQENAREAAMVKGLTILPVRHLSMLVEHFNQGPEIEPCTGCGIEDIEAAPLSAGRDFSQVKGQFNARRALEIAAAGFHNILLTGPPGSGKSMMAGRLPSILPPLSFDQAIDVTRVYSVLGQVEDQENHLFVRPFRSPHHTISDAGLVGGGSQPMPGEISLAHNGVLFLDELPEFKRHVLEVLRQPMEEGQVAIVRAGASVVYPSRFMLVAAMNPCPCGYLFDTHGQCTCTPGQVQKYRSKLSGPLLDRIDIQIEVPKIGFNELAAQSEGEASVDILKRVTAAVDIQKKRFARAGMPFNSAMGSQEMKVFCALGQDGQAMMKQAVDRIGLSGRACHSVLKVARTIADLDRCQDIRANHISEAISYRSFDREPV